VFFIGDENTSGARANLEWMEQRKPKLRLFRQTTSLRERLAKEATQLRKQAQGTPPGLSRDSFSYDRVAGIDSQAPR
jgi:hypothetical protein